MVVMHLWQGGRRLDRAVSFATTPSVLRRKLGGRGLGFGRPKKASVRISGCALKQRMVRKPSGSGGRARRFTNLGCSAVDSPASLMGARFLAEYEHRRRTFRVFTERGGGEGPADGSSGFSRSTGAWRWSSRDGQSQEAIEEGRHGA